MFPGASERALSRTPPRLTLDETRPAPETDNLTGVPAEGEERSGRSSARRFSVTALAQTHPWTAAGLLAGAALAAGSTLAAAERRRRSSEGQPEAA